MDARCRTNVVEVDAAGDVSNHDHPLFGRVRVEHYNSAEKIGRAAALSVLGHTEPFDYVHSFRSDHYEDKVEYVGHVTHLYHPGTTLTIHWLVTTVPAAPGPSTNLTLSAELQGPYASVGALKSTAPTAGAALTAAKVVVRNTSDTAPASIINLPADLAPGYYNLRTTVAYPGGRQGGDSVIQVR